LILQVEGLRKSFGQFMVIMDVSFSIKKGELSSIIGPNGAGKTTLFNLITGHLKPDKGRIIFNGEEITGLSPFQICRKKVSRSFQKSNIFPFLSVFDNIQLSILANQGKTMKLFTSARGMAKQETIAIMEEIGLSERGSDLAGNLSYGDQKLLELGIALGNDPVLLLLDEPTAGMSPAETTRTMNRIVKLTRERDMTLIFIEHDIKTVFSVSETIRVLHYGTFIAEGQPESIKNNSKVQEIYLGEQE
jgi:branched-chain amino acid transport system ATP-binding protein